MIVSGAIRNSVEYSVSEVDRVFKDILSVDGAACTPEGMERLGAMSAAHRIFTNSLAALPWQVRQKVGDTRHEVDHPVSKVLKVRANRYMTPFVCEKVIYSRAFWHGVGYALIDRDRMGRVCGLIPIPLDPTQISVNPDDGEKWYEFVVPEDCIFGRKLTGVFSESQLFIYRFESYDGQLGRGVLQMAREALDTEIKSMRYQNKFFTNGARPSGVLEVVGELGRDKREQLREEFKEKYSGDNAFKVAIMDLGMKYTPLGLSQADAQLMEGRNFSVEEISRFTGIPVYMLQSGKQSYQSNEQQQLDFVVTHLNPHLVQIEEEARVKLFSDSEIDAGYYLKKNEAALLRGTHQARAEFYEKMMAMSVYSADEVRAAEDLSPLPNGLGNTYWMSKNYAPVDDREAF